MNMFVSTLYILNILLFAFSCTFLIIFYIKHFKKKYGRFFFGMEKKFWRNVQLTLEYFLKRKILPQRNMRKDDIKKIKTVWKGNYPHIGYDVAVLNLNSDLNIGNIYRTCNCYGAQKYLIFGKKIYSLNSTAGYDFIPIEYHDVFPRLRDRLDKSTLDHFNNKLLKKVIDENNYLPIIIEQGGEYISDAKFSLIKTLNKSKKILFIFGNESWGVPDKMTEYLVKFHQGIIMSIPQIGPGKSLNVSNATSVVLYEYYRQYRKKKVYH